MFSPSKSVPATPNRLRPLGESCSRGRIWTAGVAASNAFENSFERFQGNACRRRGLAAPVQTRAKSVDVSPSVRACSPEVTTALACPPGGAASEDRAPARVQCRNTLAITLIPTIPPYGTRRQSRPPKLMAQNPNPQDTLLTKSDASPCSGAQEGCGTMVADDGMAIGTKVACPVT